MEIFDLAFTGGIFVLLVAVFLFFFLHLGESRKKRRHRKYIRKASELIRMFRSWGQGAEARIFGYLRKIHPMVFEELVLTCLEDAGAQIRRNRRYTGDGGVDGVFFLDGEKWLIQAKRYSSAIDPAHVRAFARLCGGNPGIFIHTGRTGSKSHAHRTSNVLIISGQRLIRFILGDPIGTIQDLHVRA